MARGYQQFLEDHWNRLTGEEHSGTSLKPFFPVAGKDDTELLEWFTNNLTLLEDEQENRMYEQEANMRFFKAIQQLGRDDVRVTRADGRQLNKSQMFILNHARDFVHQAVARLMRFNPAIEVYPQNNEYTDRLGARLSKRVVDHQFYVNDSRLMLEQCLLESKVCGESFQFVEWDPYIGDLDPVAMALEQMGPQEKKFFLDNQNEQVFLDVAKRVGDVSYPHPLPWMVWHEPQVRWRDVNYIYRAEIKHIDEIRAENPGIDVDSIQPITLKANKEGSYGPGFTLGEYTLQYHFYHRRHRFLDKGFYARFIPGTLLYRGPLPYSHGELPVVRFIDYIDPESAHGISFLHDLKPPLVLFNKLWNLKYRNIAIGSHPKLMVPEGACNVNSMANGPFVVEYQYPMKPELLTFPMLHGEVFTVSDGLMRQTQQLAGTFAMSRGEQIKNARAASILNFYEEQEAQREQPTMLKKDAAIEKLARLTLATTGDFYEASDERTIRIVGKSNRYKVQRVDDVAKLSGPYDIRVKSTTALAETKQGRIDQMVQLASMPISQNKNDEAKPGLFTREQILRMIEVADTEEFFEMATAAADRAESENEDMFEGIPVPAPERWQAHLVDWAIHFQFIQSREFADVQGLPQQVKDAFKQHIMTHEMWLYEQARKSLTLCQLLMELPYFPACFEIGDGPTVAQLILMHQQPPAPPPGAEPPPEEAPPPDGEAPPEEQAPPEGEPAPEQAPEQMAAPAAPSAPVEEAPKRILFERGPDGKIVGALVVPIPQEPQVEAQPQPEGLQ